MMRNSRVVTLFAMTALLASACGSRLTEEEIAIYAGSLGSANGDAAGSVTQPGAAGAPGDAPGGDAGVAAPGEAGAPGVSVPGGGAVAGPSTGGGGGGDTAGDDTAGGDTGGGTDGAENPGDGQAPPPDQDGGAQQTDTRAAPAGGNGGATDVGVTEDRIVIFQVADRTGAVPGLFEDTYDAIRAYFLMFQQTEGTVYGRQIVLETRDSQMQTQGNRSAYLDACTKAFAAVGSMSAFEQGAAGPISECGIPDIRTAAVTPDLQTLPTVVSIDSMSPGWVPLSEWSFYSERWPEAVKKAAYLFIDNSTTQWQTEQNRIATAKHLGYDWIHVKPIPLSEVNYGSIITELKNKGVEFVAFQGEGGQAAKLTKAMKDQNFIPKAFALQANVYSPDLISNCGGACDDFVYVAQTGALLEEIDSNPEMQLYAQWLKAVNPRANPTGLGMYAWAGARAFVQAVKNAGPQLTRAKILEEMDKLSGDTGNGLMPPQDYAGQVPTDCIIMLGIDQGRFVREDPAQGYRCREQPGKI
jgi:ABC-type branched-subunit amino acid transport system substrate-binding protein